MCIICNCMTDGLDSIAPAEQFLSSFSKSRQAMGTAAEAMLACSKAATTPATRRRYDRTHKRMVRLIREWNAIEQMREAD